MAVPGLVCPGAVPAEMICRSGAGGELGSSGRVGFPAHFGIGKERRWTGKSTLPATKIRNRTPWWGVMNLQNANIKIIYLGERQY